MILCHGREPSLRKEAEFEGAPVVWWFECSVCGRTSDKGHHADLAEQSWNDGWEAERTHFVELPAPTPPVIVYQEEQLYGGWLFSYDTLTYDHTAALEDSIRAAQRDGRFYPAASMERLSWKGKIPSAAQLTALYNAGEGSGYAFDRQQEAMGLSLSRLRQEAARTGDWSGYNVGKNLLMQRARERANKPKEWRRFTDLRPVTDPLELSVLIKSEYESQMWDRAVPHFTHSRYAEPAVIPTRSGAELEMIRHQLAVEAEARERERWEIQFKREHPNHLFEGRFPDHSDVADAMAYATQTLVAKRAREVAEAHKAVQESIYARDAVELLEKRKHLLVKELQDLEYRVHDKKQEMLQLKAACDAFEVLGPHRLPYPVEGSTISLSSTGCIAYMNGWEVGRCQSTYVIEEVPNKPGVFEMRPDYGYGGSPEEDDATSYHIYDYNTGTDDDD